MADIRHKQKEGSAVSDRMGYVPKPIAVIMRSENLVMSIKASNGSLFNGGGSTQVIFDNEWWVLFGHGCDTILF